MRRCTLILLLALISCQGVALYAQARGGADLVAGAAGSYYVPLENLAVRFKPTFGGSFYLEFPNDDDPTWRAALEYFDFTRENYDRLSIKRTYKVGGKDDRDFFSPLLELKTRLQVTGASVHALFHLVDVGPLAARLDLGFGVYRWYGLRGEYYDSLHADTTGNGTKSLVLILQVPEVTQTDWSGGFQAGFEVNMPVIFPLEVSAAVGYKLIIGELWPALALDLENVSGFHMVEARVALRARI